MTNPLKDIEARFDVIWGIAPWNTIKHQKGESVKEFYRKEIKELLEEIKTWDDCSEGVAWKIDKLIEGESNSDKVAYAKSHNNGCSCPSKCKV